jgi:predicted MFS family arabinose efflux permease
MLFIFYEFFGVITNLLGGWFGAKLGLNTTMNLGLFLQVLALSMLLLPSPYLTVLWLMSAQALSGVAKDLNKMSAKSAIKSLTLQNESYLLYSWVSKLTGSKNALKGIGFFLGGILLNLYEFTGAILSLMIPLCIIWLFSVVLLKEHLGKAKYKPKFKQLLAKSAQINNLSIARFFLFASRDVWFVVALPVYLSSQFNWTHWQIGSFFAFWIIGYGLIQSCAHILSKSIPNGRSLTILAIALLFVITLLLLSFYFRPTEITLIIGLLVFAVVFALNSAQHSFLIIQFSDPGAVSLDVGFYYMANAGGRLCGTVLSGIIYQLYGLPACLLISALCIALAAFFANKLTLDDTHSSLKQSGDRL